MAHDKNQDVKHNVTDSSEMQLPKATINLERDKRTKVIVYGPVYQASKRYDVVVNWKNHHTLTFKNIGDGIVQSGSFEPVDSQSTGKSDEVDILITNDISNHFQVFVAPPVNAAIKLVWFYDYQIGRDVVVTILLISHELF